MVAADRLGRWLRDLRISVIDRCNFRCPYCMPAELFTEDYQFVPRNGWLTFEEIERLASLFARLGAGKLRITGGEPLLRPALPELVRQLAAIEGITDIALTTNGVLLPRHAAALREAGVNRVTVSLDSLEPAVFERMSGHRGQVEQVLAGIDAAVAAGFKSVKVNTVVQRGVNDHTVMALLEHFRGTGHIVRLIEFMDVGTRNGWNFEAVVPSAELRARIDARWPLRALPPAVAGETARRYAYRDGAGEIGFISSVSQPFCGGCTRARLSCDGVLYTCLFAHAGLDLRALLRSGADDEAVIDAVTRRWQQRDDRYSEERGEVDQGGRVEMYRVGG